MATDTTIVNLVINKMTKAQYDALQQKSETELYLVPDAIDAAPTKNSSNLVESGGVYDEIHTAEQSSIPENGMLPNKVYMLGRISGTVVFSLASAPAGEVAHYYWTFNTGSTAPVITWPMVGTIVWNKTEQTPTIQANKHYEVSLLGYYGFCVETNISSNER